ncbi:MAG: radical SAM protein [Desulfobacterales bacterium]|nr:radical SAM protein [Desulfobacterales bacterium]
MKSFTEKNSSRKQLNSILPLPMPLGICIEPTNFCNFKCIQCPASLKDFHDIVGSKGHMRIDLFEKILQNIKEMGRLKNLNLYGDGEPFLCDNLVSMVKKAVCENVSEVITVTTNASLIDEKTALAIIKSGLTYLRVSIYGTTEEKFRRNTKARVSLQKIRDNLMYLKTLRDSLKQEKPFIYIKMIDTYDKNTSDEFVSQYKEIADEINIETPMNWNGYGGYDFIHQVDPSGKTDQTKIQGFYLERGISGYKKICTTAFHSLNIKQNGDVVICIVDWNKGTKVGNIKEQTLKEIWFGDQLRQFRLMHINGERHKNVSCKNCQYLYGNPDSISDLSPERYQEILNFKGV